MRRLALVPVIGRGRGHLEAVEVGLIREEPPQRLGQTLDGLFRDQEVRLLTPAERRRGKSHQERRGQEQGTPLRR